MINCSLGYSGWYSLGSCAELLLRLNIDHDFFVQAWLCWCCLKRSQRVINLCTHSRLGIVHELNLIWIHNALHVPVYSPAKGFVNLPECSVPSSATTLRTIRRCCPSATSISSNHRSPRRKREKGSTTEFKQAYVVLLVGASCQAKRYKQPSTQSNRSVFNDRPVMRKNSLSLDVHPLSTFAYFLYTD